MCSCLPLDSIALLYRGLYPLAVGSQNDVPAPLAVKPPVPLAHRPHHSGVHGSPTPSVSVSIDQGPTWAKAARRERRSGGHWPWGDCTLRGRPIESVHLRCTSLALPLPPICENPGSHALLRRRSRREREPPLSVGGTPGIGGWSAVLEAASALDPTAAWSGPGTPLPAAGGRRPSLSLGGAPGIGGWPLCCEGASVLQWPRACATWMWALLPEATSASDPTAPVRGAWDRYAAFSSSIMRRSGTSFPNTQCAPHRE
mmetsp:Transcript_33414/g.54877  ORF Transcript_33414/g.54877 Transcript_33414/m.54877 type:complete len:257 (-) Transcript_33414:149-919(-)